MHGKSDGKYYRIAGAEEGIYAWIAANYAIGTLGGNPKDATGIVELGGASAQVLFFFSLCIILI